MTILTSPGRKETIRVASAAGCFRFEPPGGADWRLKERVVLVMCEVFEPPTGGKKRRRRSRAETAQRLQRRGGAYGQERSEL